MTPDIWTLGFLVALFLIVLGGSATAHTFSYTVETRGDVESDVAHFRDVARATLSDIRGWTLNHNMTYTLVRSNQDFRLILASPEEVDRESPVRSPQWSCRVGDQVLINDRRWQNATPTWPLSLSHYRYYVINHEVGHWLGLGHDDCPGEDRDAPVMMQQSKGLDGCRARVWPKHWERERVSEIRGIAGWPVPPRDAPCSIEATETSQRLEGTHHADVVCGSEGDNEIYTKSGYDVIRAGSGNDEVGSGSQNDVG